MDCCHGVWRVHGSLAVSRAIGDRHLKQWVVAEPATKIFKIRPECEFLILASDGLWDNVSFIHHLHLQLILALLNALDAKFSRVSRCRSAIKKQWTLSVLYALLWISQRHSLLAENSSTCHKQEDLLMTLASWLFN